MSKLFLRSALIFCVGVGTASTAFAQQVSLTINNGRVTLKAQNATVRQILDEWARVGGTKVVNGEKIVSQPVTLTLVDEPEGSALEIVLRSAAGYIVAERANPAANVSRYERILVMARSTPVAAAAGQSANAYTANGPTPPGGNFMAEGPVNADDDDPPQPVAPVVNPYAQGTAAVANAAAGVNPNSGVPGMGTGLGQQQQAATAAGNPGSVSPQQGANMTPPGYSNVYGQTGSTQLGTGTASQSSSFGSTTTGAAGSPAGSTVNVNPPETKFDYANPQKYFQQRSQQNGQNFQPYPGVPLSGTAAGSGTPSASTPPAAGGTPGTVTPTQTGGINPYSPNFNPYNLPAGQGVPSSNGTPATPVEPDRAKYANPYVQPSSSSQPPE
jgi:hypothetical protein